MSLEDKIDQAKGALKEGLGKVTGDKKTEKEGAAEKVSSKVKEVAEDVKDAIDGTIEGVKNIVNKDQKQPDKYSIHLHKMPQASPASLVKD